MDDLKHLYNEFKLRSSLEDINKYESARNEEEQERLALSQNLVENKYFSHPFTLTAFGKQCYEIFSLKTCLSYKNNSLFCCGRTKVSQLKVNLKYRRLFIDILNTDHQISIPLFLLNGLTIFSSSENSNVVFNLNGIPTIKAYIPDRNIWIQSCGNDNSALGYCSKYCLVTAHSVALEIKNAFEILGFNINRVENVKNYEKKNHIAGGWSGCKNSDDLLNHNLSIKIRYYLHCLTSSNKINLISTKNVNDCINVLSDEHHAEDDLITTLLYLYHSKVETHEPWVIADKILKRMNDKRVGNQNEKKKILNTKNNNLALVKVVTVTPMRYVVQPPEITETNRVLRKYPHLLDRFIRVRFSDERSDYLDTRSDHVMSRVTYILTNGLLIGGRKYVFLGYSNSQISNHSIWFYDEDTVNSEHVLSAEAIRRDLGDFSHIQTASKLGSRIGQAFSASKDTVTLNKDEFGFIDDISGSKGRCFSDGVGLISKAKAFEVMKIFSKRQSVNVPSAFQIRFGGCKGVLSVWPDDYFPPGKSVLFRPSMKKFESDHQTIEVLKYSGASMTFLNHALINILTARGIKDENFLELQEEAFTDIECFLHSKANAIRLLQNYNYGQQNVNFNSHPLAMVCKVLEQTTLSITEPFINRVLKAFRETIFLILKDRARILIKKGILLIGVLDEANVLKEGEIFCQIADPNTGMFRVIEGNVIVGRSPSLHPGDVRELKCVNRPELQHLKNVVVFSSEG